MRSFAQSGPARLTRARECATNAPLLPSRTGPRLSGKGLQRHHPLQPFWHRIGSVLEAQPKIESWFVKYTIPKRFT
jgi:hypothetical protein